MASDKSKWVCRFYIEEPQTHENGFTVYKLTSLVFPASSPEAGTRLIVWKRFNDFKRLHNVIKESCKTLNIPGLPDLCKTSFFNRFDIEIIKERVKSAQRFIDFIAGNKTLFLGGEFKIFCERGYKLKMGQGESVGYEHQTDTYLDDNNWKWVDERLGFEEDSSDDESGAASTDSGTSLSPRHSHTAQPNTNWSNNNISPSCHPTNTNVPLEESEEVIDAAGGGGIDLKPPVSENDTEVICHSERPVSVDEVWLAVPPAEDRLAAYRVVGIIDPILIVVHSSRPQVKLALKVLRKSSWPILLGSSVGEPRPVPHMIRLIDWIETEDAVFVVTELITGGRLSDHIQDPIGEDRVSVPDPASDVDILVIQAQRLLASVNRTLERSAEQHQQLKTAETVLDTRDRKPRSRSVLPRARLERRFSSDDATGLRPRTAHGSLERVSRKHLKIAAESSVREWGAGLVAGLDSFHSYGLIWKDLYPGNLLWGSGGHLLLTFQHRWKGVETPLHPVALSGLFVAPEVLSVFPFGSACDWWSVGVLLYELLTGVPLAEDYPTGLNSHTILDLPDFLSIESRSLLTGLLQYDPNDRLGGGIYGSEEIKSHPFFRDIDWDEVYNEL